MSYQIFKKSQLSLKEDKLPDGVSVTMDKPIGKVSSQEIRNAARKMKNNGVSDKMVVNTTGNTVNPETNNNVAIVTGDKDNINAANNAAKKAGAGKVIVDTDMDVSNGIPTKDESGNGSSVWNESVIFTKDEILELIES